MVHNNEICTERHFTQCRYWRHIQQRTSLRRKYERAVFKSGEYNFEKTKRRKFRVFSDIFSRFVEDRWRWTLVYCFLVYIITWILFGVIWWAILYIHGDLESEHLPNAKNYNTTDRWKPCVREIYDFTSIFLFSIEIHTTIGYGKRSITLECPTAILTMCLESITGSITRSLIVGIVFAKLTRPKNRAHTIIFSNNAIVNQRDGHLCILFRIGNTRKSRIIAAKVQGYLLRNRQTSVCNDAQIELDLKVDESDDIFLIFPISVVHKIKSSSPFYNMSAKDILTSNIEMLVVFEGIIESTGQPVQARTSYTSQEILWGRRFLQMAHFQKDKRGFVIDFSKLNETYRVNTPLCTPKELDEFYSRKQSEDYLLSLRDLIMIPCSAVSLYQSK